MNTDDPTPLTLQTLCKGAAEEMFQAALAEVAENIFDPNTKWNTKRTITLTVTFAPNEDRDASIVTTDVKTKPAPAKGAGGIVHMGRLRGGPVVVVNDPNQLQIKFDRDDQIRTVGDAGSAEDSAAKAV